PSFLFAGPNSITSFFSHSCRTLLQQPFCFDIHTKCPGSMRFSPHSLSPLPRPQALTSHSYYSLSLVFSAASISSSATFFGTPQAFCFFPAKRYHHPSLKKVIFADRSLVPCP